MSVFESPGHRRLISDGRPAHWLHMVFRGSNPVGAAARSLVLRAPGDVSHGHFAEASSSVHAFRLAVSLHAAELLCQRMLSLRTPDMRSGSHSSS